MSIARGSCLCGQVAFELVGPALRVVHCHCSRCRKSRGTGHATNLAAPLAQLRFLRGEELLQAYKVESAKFFTHTFCRACGSTMPTRSPERGIAIVPLGAFDDAPPAPPERHIFVGSKAAWEEITDALPQFDGPPPPS